MPIEPTFDNVKLGKKLGRIEDPRTFQLGEFLPRTAIADLKIPKRSRLGTRRRTVPMYRNNEFGCCTIASSAHRVILQEAATGQGKEAVITDEDVLAGYSAVTGFDEDDPRTDNGAYMLDVANYLRHVGIGKQNDGTAHVVRAYAQIPHLRLEYVRAASMIFGGLWVGVWLPRSAAKQEVWDVPEGGPIGDGEPGSWGGHAIYVAGYDTTGLSLYTWGREMKMTWAFWSAYVDEAYVFISDDFLYRRTQETPHGFDMERLQGYIGELDR